MPSTKISPIGVGRLPGRERPALFEMQNGRVTVLAYFVSEEAMHTFLSHEPRVNEAHVGGRRVASVERSDAA